MSESLLETIQRLQGDEKNDLTLRFMRLVHRAERYGVEIRLVAFPKDARSVPINQFRQVGAHDADLTCQLDMIDAYVTGLAWRDEPHR